MNFESLSLPVIYALIFTSSVLFMSLDWRVMLTALGLQYAGVFVLVGMVWPMEMAVIKLVTGLIAATILGMELVKIPAEGSLLREIQGEPFNISSRIFRIFLALLMGFAVYSLAPALADWVYKASYHQIMGSTLLFGMGILILGTTEKPFRIVIGLLTFLSGFEILFATLESSALIAGLFSFLHLGISFLGTYFIASLNMEVER